MVTGSSIVFSVQIPTSAWRDMMRVLAAADFWDSRLFRRYNRAPVLRGCDCVLDVVLGL